MARQDEIDAFGSGYRYSKVVFSQPLHWPDAVKTFLYTEQPILGTAKKFPSFKFMDESELEMKRHPDFAGFSRHEAKALGWLNPAEMAPNSKADAQTAPAAGIANANEKETGQCKEAEWKSAVSNDWEARLKFCATIGDCPDMARRARRFASQNPKSLAVPAEWELFAVCMLKCIEGEEKDRKPQGEDLKPGGNSFSSECKKQVKELAKCVGQLEECEPLKKKCVGHESPWGGPDGGEGDRLCQQCVWERCIATDEQRGTESAAKGRYSFNRASGLELQAPGNNQRMGEVGPLEEPTNSGSSNPEAGREMSIAHAPAERAPCPTPEDREIAMKLVHGYEADRDERKTGREELTQCMASYCSVALDHAKDAKSRKAHQQSIDQFWQVYAECLGECFAQPNGLGVRLSYTCAEEFGKFAKCWADDGPFLNPTDDFCVKDLEARINKNQ